MDLPGPQPMPIFPSPSKLAAREPLEALGVKLSDGTDYMLPLIASPTATLAQARHLLNPVTETLAAIVLDERRQP